jgi:ribosomal protein S12 methylthiotransferase
MMAVQQEVAFAWNDSRIGSQCDVLLDVPVEGERDVWIGRTYADAPDVDAVAFVTGKRLRAGDIVPCEVVATQGYDLVVAPVGKVR